MITFDNNGDSTTLALGGYNDDDNVLKSIEKWNPETETWSEVGEQLEEKRAAFDLAFTDQKFYISFHTTSQNNGAKEPFTIQFTHRQLIIFEI